MSDRESRHLSRREFIKRAALLGGAAAITPILQACAPTPTAPPAAAPTTAPKAVAPTTAPVTAPTTAPAPVATTAPAAKAAATAAPTTAAAAKAAAPAVNLQTNATMTMLWGVPPPNFNPLVAVAGPQYQLLDTVLQGLTWQLPDKTGVSPNLAESWTISPDGTEYTFKLHPKAMWHDGKPVTAQDVAFTYERGLNPLTKSRLIGRLSIIKGGADYSSNKADKIEGIQVVDDKTIKFITAYPTGLFMLESSIHVMPKHILGDAKPEDLEKHRYFIEAPVGSGPFKFVRYVTDQYAEVEANPDYVLGKPKLAKINYRIIKAADTAQIALERGEVHWNSGGGIVTTPEVIDSFAKNPGFNVVATSGTVLTIFGFNLRKPIMQDKRVRQAWYHAIDRRRLIDTFLGGNGQMIETPLAHPWIQKPLAQKYEFNPDKAKGLLSAANWDANREVTVSVTPITSESTRAQYAAMQQMLAAVGIKIKFQEYETAVWVTKFYDDHDYEAVSIGAGIFTDPDGFLKFHMVKGSKDAFGYVDVAGPEFASWVDEAGRLTDQAKRKEIYFKIQDKLNEDLPLAVMWLPSDLWVLNNKVYIPFLTEGEKVKTLKDAPVLPAQRHFFYNMHEWGMKV